MYVKAKLLTWQWAKVTRGESPHLLQSFIFKQTELSVLLQGPWGSLDNDLRADAYHANGWSLNFGKLEYWTVPRFLLCPRKVPQDGHKQLLNKQGCFENGDYQCLLSALSHFFLPLFLQCAAQSLSFYISFAPYQFNRKCMLECKLGLSKEAPKHTLQRLVWHYYDGSDTKQESNFGQRVLVLWSNNKSDL